MSETGVYCVKCDKHLEVQEWNDHLGHEWNKTMKISPKERRRVFCAHPITILRELPGVFTRECKTCGACWQTHDAPTVQIGWVEG